MPAPTNVERLQHTITDVLGGSGTW